jgi:hypothetical protein
MSLIDVDALVQSVNGDPEFAIAARYWDATLKLTMGESKYMIFIKDGRIDSLDGAPALMEDWDYDFCISAPEEEWEKILQPVPPPFYKALLPAVLLHGFDFGGDFSTFCSYYRAFSRLVEIMRENTTSAEEG